MTYLEGQHDNMTTSTQAPTESDHSLAARSQTDRSQTDHSQTEQSDPRLVFARALALGGTLVSQVTSDQMTLPTPCSEYDVRTLLGHLLGVVRRVAAVGRAEDPFSVPEVVDLVDDEWLEAWKAAETDVAKAWADDASLTQMVVLPWAELPGGAILNMYAGEVTTHSWDLATAIGQSPAWDEEVLTLSLSSIRQLLPGPNRMAMFEEIRATMPADQQAWTPPFSEMVDVADDAPLIDQLVAWCGRKPASTLAR